MEQSKVTPNLTNTSRVKQKIKKRENIRDATDAEN
jgi:hypothetical protein